MDPRTILTDRQWELISPYLPGKPGDPGRTGRNNRMALEGMLWVTRTGAPWRDLPEEFGNWNSLHRRFRRWVERGIFEKIFDAVDDLDLKAVMVDGTFAKVHQHAAGAKKVAARLVNRLSVKPSAGAGAGLLRNSWSWLTRAGAW